MKITLEPSYLIHSIPYRETSIIAEWFTQNHGRISSVVKGVRKKSRAKSRLLPFCEYQASWYGRGSLVTVTDWDLINSRWLTGNNLAVGLYINELIMRLFTPGDGHPLFFARYKEFLQDLDNKAHLNALTRRIELVLLKELGYEIVFDREAENSDRIQGDKNYRFEPDVGFTEVADASGQADYPGSLLLKVHKKETLNRAELELAKRLTRHALLPHLGSKPLKSRDLLPPKRRKESTGG